MTTRIRRRDKASFLWHDKLCAFHASFMHEALDKKNALWLMDSLCFKVHRLRSLEGGLFFHENLYSIFGQPIVATRCFYTGIYGRKKSGFLFSWSTWSSFCVISLYSVYRTKIKWQSRWIKKNLFRKQFTGKKGVNVLNVIKVA